MSFEESLMSALNLAKSSPRVSVKQVALSATYALAVRTEASAEARKIDADPTIAPADKMGTKKAKAASRLKELHDGRLRLAKAEAELRSSLPPIPQSETPGGASVDAELRAFVRGLPADKRGNISEAAALAVARGPVELSGMVPSQHAQVVEGVRRRLYPDAMAQWDADAQVVEAAKVALDAAVETSRSALGLGEAYPTFVRTIGATSLV